jgi:cell division transport system permease protein
MEQKTNKKKIGGYPAVGVVISTTLALFVIGTFGIILSYSNQFEKRVRENITFKVYLKNSLSETQLRQLQQNIREKQFVAESEKAIVFVSKDEAEKDLGDVGDFKEILGDNPLKDMLEVRIDPAFHDSTSLNKVKAEMERISGVLEAVYEKDMMDDINENFTKISIVLLSISGVLLLTVVLLINNTLRLALFSQRFLIRSMQLVGAKQWFIQRPFLLRAAMYGMLAGIIASALLTGLTNYAYRRVENLTILYDQQQYTALLGAIILLGAVIAVTSTYFAIRRYLHMTLDELI